MTSAIHEQRLREAEAELDRVAAAIRPARKSLQRASSRVESLVRVQAEARRPRRHARHAQIGRNDDPRDLSLERYYGVGLTTLAGSEPSTCPIADGQI